MRSIVPTTFTKSFVSKALNLSPFGELRRLFASRT